MTINFTEMLIAIRTGHEMQQKALAEKLEISPQYLNDLEAGRRLPSVAVVEKIVTHFGRGPVGRSIWHIAGARAHGWDVPPFSNGEAR